MNEEQLLDLTQMSWISPDICENWRILNGCIMEGEQIEAATVLNIINGIFSAVITSAYEVEKLHLEQEDAAALGRAMDCLSRLYLVYHRQYIRGHDHTQPLPVEQVAKEAALYEEFLAYLKEVPQVWRLRKMEAEIQQLQKALEDCQAENARLFALHKQPSHTDELEAQLQQAAKTQATLEARIVQLMQESKVQADLEAQIVSLQTQLAERSEAQGADATAKINLEAYVQTLQDELEAQQAEAADRIAALQAQLAEQSEAQETAAAEHGNLNAQIASLQAQLAEQQQTANLCQALQTQLETQQAEAQAAAQLAADRIAKLEAALLAAQTAPAGTPEVTPMPAPEPVASKFKEVVIGHAEVRQIYKIPKVGNVMGCYVLDGNVVHDCRVRVVRGGIVIHEGKLVSLRRFQDDVKEVTQYDECGMQIEHFSNVMKGDIIECFMMVPVPESQPETPEADADIFHPDVVDHGVCRPEACGRSKIGAPLDAIRDQIETLDLTLCNAQEITDQAFQGCPNLKSIIFPLSIVVGNETFSDCPKLEDVHLEYTSHIGDGAFRNCPTLRKVYFTSRRTKIGQGAFDGCPNVAFRCRKNSTAAAYAEAHGFDIF